MNKGDLINTLKKEIGLSNQDAKKAVESVFSSITDALKKQQIVTIIGFGTFKVDHRNARTGRNPMTGETIEIKAKKVPKFLPGKGLKETVNL